MTGINMEYNIIYRNKTTGQFLESRQGNQPTFEDIAKEANLYKAWAEFHYKCDVTYVVKFNS